MRKLALILLSLLFLSLSTSVVNASLLAINQGGEVVWNVLSEEDNLALDIPKHSYLEIKEVGNVKSNTSAVVSLVKDNEKISLIVFSDNKTREMDVSGWSDDLVEIEERAEVQKIIIGITDNLFSLEQKGIKALTEFPVNIDAKKAELSVTTPSGNKFLSILPYQAVETLLRSKVLSKVANNEIEIVENEQELQYLVRGERVLNVLSLFEYSVPVTSRVSAATGEVLSLEAPIWYKAISFLFT